MHSHQDHTNKPKAGEIVPHIWIVEDDEDIREIAIYALRTANFEAIGFESGDNFFAKLASLKIGGEAGSKTGTKAIKDASNETDSNSPPDLVILDIMLPGENGLTILKKLRQHPQYNTLPIMMLTAKGSEHDKVKGLDLGADDYITKPFGVMELISRIKALLRRSNLPTEGSQPNQAPPLSFQSIQMNHTSRTVTVAGEAVNLTFKEYELLHYLLINAEIVLGRDKILETVWGYDYEGESRTLDMHVKSLRQKLRQAGELIKTVRNVGYKLGV